MRPADGPGDRQRSKRHRVRGLRDLLWGAMVMGAIPAEASAGDTARHVPAMVEVDVTNPDVAADDAVFDRQLLSGHRGDGLDLSRFERGHPVLAGLYDLDIQLADTWLGRAAVRFAIPPGHRDAVACMSRSLLEQLHLRPPTAVAAALDRPGSCVEIGQVFPAAQAVPDMADLRLQLSVPQVYLAQPARGYVSPGQWDQGVPAALLNYNFNAYRSSHQGVVQTSAYLALGSGLNLAGWHLRHDASVSWMSVRGPAAVLHWQNIDLYARHDLPAWRAQLTLGDSYTDGQVFDSFGIRGVQLATDDRMLPDSLRGYAPVIRGVASSNARVVVSQRGLQIYQATVAPGPFAIRDLYPTGYGGSLDVVVTEADGSLYRFSVPYASVAQLLRPGISRFDIAAGQLRDLSLQHRPWLLQGSYQRGFSNRLTAYAGAVGASGYMAGLLGAAFNTRFGALALDITHARTGLLGEASHSGQSVRLSYSKLVPGTDTSFSVMAYRYSGSGYFSLTDAALARDSAQSRRPFPGQGAEGIWNTGTAAVDGTWLAGQATQTAAVSAASSGWTARSLQRARSTFSLSLSQPLGLRGGSLYANVSAHDYWGRPGTDAQFQMGYSNRLWRFSYNLSATRTRDWLARNVNELMLNVTLPLGSGGRAPSLGLNLAREAGRLAPQLMLNGSLGERSQFSYGASAAEGDGGGVATINGGWRGGYGAAALSYGRGPGFSQSSVGLAGTVVAHPGGITLGQLAGDTLAIVHAEGARGASVLNMAGARIDRGGYALVPYLTPYNLNAIQLDPKGLPLDVELQSSGAQVAPHAGAVVMVVIKTRSGRTAFVRLHQAGGGLVPFGTGLVDAGGHSLGVVGQSGLALVRGLADHGRLYAHWRTDEGVLHDCAFDYRYRKPRRSGRRPFESVLDLVCVAVRAAGARGKEGL